MKTIKVIDLLNKIANDEEVPTIEYKGMRTICYYLYDRCGEQCDDRELKNILNYEVEIIEEEKKVPEKLDLYKSDDTTLKGLVATVNVMFEDTANKINDLLDYLESKEKGE